MATLKQLQKMYKDLANLDDQRKILITNINQHPTSVIAYIRSFIIDESSKNVWYKRSNIESEKPHNNQVLQLINHVDIKHTSTNTYTANLQFKNLNGDIVHSPVLISSKKALRGQVFQTLEVMSSSDLLKFKKEIKKLEMESTKNKAISELEVQLAKIQEELIKLKKS